MGLLFLAKFASCDKLIHISFAHSLSFLLIQLYIRYIHTHAYTQIGDWNEQEIHCLINAINSIVLNSTFISFLDVSLCIIATCYLETGVGSGSLLSPDSLDHLPVLFGR